ncbi:MAG: hypothetical protein U0L49_00160, partial [Eubacterium sp.]|nr:hypothetical protein [Eubacterium sp.]
GPRKRPHSQDVITENISTDKVSYSTENKDGQKKVIAVYLPPFYFSEVGVAKRIQAILKAPTGKSKADTDTVPKNDRADGIHYDRITDVGNALEPRGE